MIDITLLLNTGYAFERTAHAVPAIARAQEDEEASVLTWEMAVAIVNSALALELYLKALWAIERDDDPPKTHRLSILFDGLSAETRSSLEAAYNNSSPMRWSIAEMLDKAGYLFEEYRYPHEWSAGGTRVQRSSSYELWVPALFRERIVALQPTLILYDPDANACPEGPISG